MATETSADLVEERPSGSVNDAGGNHRIARLVATVAGLLGALLAIATPLLPVNQTTAQLNWPQNGTFASVEAPLIGYVATDLKLTVPCQAAAGLTGPQNAGKTVLLSTVPKQAPKAVDRGLLIQRVNDDLVLVVRNVPVVAAPLSQVLGPACRQLTFSAHADRVTAEFVGLQQGPNAEHPGSPLRGEKSGYDFRPQIVGVFTDLAGPAPPGLSLSATVDTRYSTSPTPLKLAAMILGVVLTIAALVALHVLDTADGTRHRRFLPPRWWSIGTLDGLVIAVLVWWHFVGANTSDDGYILTMARVCEHAGYMANYYRWFGTPEAPFGWYYDLLALWAHVSTTSIWMRLPTLAMALTCWWVISREVMPRLGQAVKKSRGVDGGGHVPGRLVAARQRPASRADHRPGDPADLVFGGARGGHQPAPAGGDRLHHRCADPVLRADRYRLNRRAAGRDRAAADHPAPQIQTIRHLAPGGARGGRGHRHGYPDLPRPDPGRRDPGQHAQARRRSQPELVRRTPPLRAAVHGQPRRVGGPPLRRAGVGPRARDYGGDVVAQGPNSGDCRRTEPSHRRDHHHLVRRDDVHSDQMDTPFRGVRRAGRIAGRAGRGRCDVGGHALPAQPHHVRRRGVVPGRTVVRQRQRLVVCLQFRCAVV